MTPSQIADPLIGRLVDGRYRVRARIARGGMATVYVATDLRLERRVALKVMHGHLSDDSVFQSRFIQEARAAARLSDPHVVNVFDQGQDDELAYLVMEYLPGITLRDLLKEQRRLSVPQTVTIMDAILSGLAAAHRAGIVHRDVKPENVLLAEDGRIKIGDFGLARATSANTATGQQLMGTIAYLAPELVTRGTADARSDIYALGIMLYEMLTGEQPYRGEQPMQIAFQHATESVPRPSVRNPGVPEQLDELVLWSTERDPNDRPLDAQTMLDRLREIEHELGITPVITRREAPVTAGLSIPDATTTGGITTILPLEAETGAIGQIEPVDTTDNATRLRRSAARARRRGVWWVLLVLLLAALAGLAGWWFGSGPGSKIGIPDLTNQPAAAATDALTSLGLQPNEVPEASLDIEAGNVTRTDPAAGEHVDKASAVTVYVSAGPAEVTLPSFVGVSEQDATALFAAHRMELSDPVYEFTGDVAADTIISVAITPRAGGEAASCTEGCNAFEGDTVAIVVSKGEVPAVRGASVQDARAALEAAGLTVSSDSPKVFTDDPAKDTVAYVTNSTRDGNWRTGDEVTMWVSAGPMPDVVGVSVDTARTRLTEVGLSVASENVEENSETVTEGAVIRLVDRDGGGDWRVGDSVTLVVSLGPPPVEVPNVIGMTRDEAKAALTNAGLKVSYAGYWDVIPDQITQVVGQDLTAGSFHKRGSTVTLRIAAP